MDSLDWPKVSYKSENGDTIRFVQYAKDRLPGWAVDVRAAPTDRDEFAKVTAQQAAITPMSDALRAKITELVADYRGRTYNYPADRQGPETVARNGGKEDAFNEAADDLEAILKSMT